MTLKEFTTAYYDKRYKSSTVPAHAQPRKPFHENSANELTKTVLAYFEFKGIKAWRQASEGRFIRGKEYTDWAGRPREEKGTFIPRSKAAKGIGDICALTPRFTSIEIKYGKDRQSDDQKKFQKEIENSGGIYMIVRTWEDFYLQITKLNATKETSS